MEIKKGNTVRGPVSFKCTIPLASYRIIVNTDYTRSGGNEGRTAAPLIANWLRYRNNTGEPVTLRFLLHQVRYGYSFSLSARCFVPTTRTFRFPCLNVRVRRPVARSSSRVSLTLFFSLYFPPFPPLCLSVLFSTPLFTFSLLSTFLCSGPFVENVVIQFIPPFFVFTLSLLLFLSSSWFRCFVSFVRYLSMFQRFYRFRRFDSYNDVW